VKKGKNPQEKRMEDERVGKMHEERLWYNLRPKNFPKTASRGKEINYKKKKPTQSKNRGGRNT